MIYFNNAATSFPKPPEVIEAVKEYISSIPFHSARAGFDFEEEDVAFACRTKLAKLFNAPEPEQIVFTSGSTESLNLAIKGLELYKAHVVTTGIEHNSVIRPLKHLELDGKIKLTFVDCDATSNISPESIKAAMKDNTKAVVVNHSSNVTGSILDLKAIAKIAHEHGAKLIVDASQSSGNVPINVSDWDIDLLAFTGHKSLYGLQGIGGLYIKKGLNLKPLKVGGTGIKSDVLVQPPGMPIYYEAGTPNMPGIVSLNAGAGFLLEKGVDSIREHKASMVKRMINELKDYPEITNYTISDKNSFANFCFTVDKMVPEEVGYVLESSYDIVVRTGLHCAPLLMKPLGVYPWGTVRVSPSYFSTDDEITKFIEAMKEIVNVFVRKNKNVSEKKIEQEGCF